MVGWGRSQDAGCSSSGGSNSSINTHAVAVKMKSWSPRMDRRSYLHLPLKAGTDQSCPTSYMHVMNSMKLVIPLHSLYWSIHTKDESKRGTAFAFIFGVN